MRNNIWWMHSEENGQPPIRSTKPQGDANRWLSISLSLRDLQHAVLYRHKNKETYLIAE